MLPIRNINPGMLALIMLSLYNSKFDGKKFGAYYIYVNDFDALIKERDMTIPENDFMAEFIEWLHQFSLNLIPYNNQVHAISYRGSDVFGRVVSKKALRRFNSLTVDGFML